MELKPGAKLGRYELVSQIGKGGMGEVWMARDPQLKRDVAIKVSAQQFTDRFEREAHAIAALNHPNVCTLYDVGPNYLVMELVEGPTLFERMAEGPVPLEEALGIAKQIGDALEAAHDKAIVHRDLKPANVKIRPDGSVKVLDFGLAKAAEEEEVTPDSPTIKPTQLGMIVGTPGYMSPEQARGLKVDKRTDIWAFAVVLYEMLTGRRLFEGATFSDTLASVLTKEPDLTLIPERTRRLLSRCLEKDPNRRLRDITGVEFLLEESSVAAVRSRAPWGSVAAGVFALIAAALAFIHFREKPPEVPVTRFTLAPPEKGRFLNGLEGPPAVSPGGRSVVFPAASADGKSQLWLRSLDGLTAQPLAGTENATFPFWAPDNKSIGFFAGGKLKKMDISGGPSTALADAPDGRGGTWSQDGVIIFAPTPYSGPQQISASGGVARAVTRVDAKGGSQRFPWFLPDGRHFLYLVGGVGSKTEIRIGSLEARGKDPTLLGGLDSFAVYAQGRLLYLRGATLVARPFDTKRLTFTGEAVPVAEAVRVSNAPANSAEFSASVNGVLVYEAGSGDLRLTWLDRAGKRLGTLGDAGALGALRFSPDGKTVAVADRGGSANQDIWLYDVVRGLRTRFTFDPALDGAPVWSPDGRTIVFRSTRTGPSDLYRKPADGSRNEGLLYADNLDKWPMSFSPDGKYLAYRTQDPKTGFDIWILPEPLAARGAAKPRPFMRTEFNEDNPQFSPDGHWLAYMSNESRRNEIYVAPFPGPGGKRQVSTAGGIAPRWRQDGKELFYRGPDGRLMDAEVNAKGGAFEVGKVEALFGGIGGDNGSYDVSADGQRFLAAFPPEGETGAPLTVVQNWTAGLKK